MADSKRSTYSETEEKIFLAAMEAFGEHGLKGARMQEIADRAGINKALVHYYFRSKEKLYEAVFDFILQKYFTALSEALSAETSFEHLLRSFIDRYYDIVESNPTIPRFILREVSSGAPVFSKKVRAFLTSLEKPAPRVFVQSLAEAVQKGQVRKVDPIQTFVTVMGACVYYFMAYPLLSVMIPDLATNRQAIAEKRKAHIFDILYHGLKPRSDET